MSCHEGGYDVIGNAVYLHEMLVGTLPIGHIVTVVNNVYLFDGKPAKDYVHIKYDVQEHHRTVSKPIPIPRPRSPVRYMPLFA